MGNIHPDRPMPTSRVLHASVTPKSMASSTARRRILDLLPPPSTLGVSRFTPPFRSQSAAQCYIYPAPPGSRTLATARKGRGGAAETHQHRRMVPRGDEQRRHRVDALERPPLPHPEREQPRVPSEVPLLAP